MGADGGDAADATVDAVDAAAAAVARVIAPEETTRLDPSREGRDNPPEFDAVYF